MSRIETLTVEQERDHDRFFEEAMRWGTCTDPADRPLAEKTVTAMYAEIGQKKPPIFLWCDSPATSLLAIEVLKDERFWSSLESSLWSSLESSLAVQYWQPWVCFYRFCGHIGVKYEPKSSKRLAENKKPAGAVSGAPAGHHSPSIHRK